VTHFIDLLVNRGGRKITQQFYVINLGSDRIILGYLWLCTFTSDIDWPNCKTNWARGKNRNNAPHQKPLPLRNIGK
jgi:hypothetical protein